MQNFIVDILLNYINIRLIPRRLSKEVALSPCMFHVPEVLPSSVGRSRRPNSLHEIHQRFSHVFVNKSFKL